MVRPAGGFPPPFTFITRMGLIAQTLAQMLDSLVRVSRRVACGHYASRPSERVPRSGTGRIAPRAITPPAGGYVPGAFVRPSEPALACRGRVRRAL